MTTLSSPPTLVGRLRSVPGTRTAKPLLLFHAQCPQCSAVSVHGVGGSDFAALAEGRASRVKHCACPGPMVRDLRLDPANEAEDRAEHDRYTQRRHAWRPSVGPVAEPPGPDVLGPVEAASASLAVV